MARLVCIRNCQFSATSIRQQQEKCCIKPNYNEHKLSSQFWETLTESLQLDDVGQLFLSRQIVHNSGYGLDTQHVLALGSLLQGMLAPLLTTVWGWWLPH